MQIVLNKTVSIFITALMAVCFLSVPFLASAQEPAKLTVSSVKGEPGKDVVVSVMVSQNSGIAAMDFILNYDNSKLLYKSYKAGSASEGALFILNPNYKNPDGSSALKQGFAHAEGVSVEGSIVDITFTIAPGWSGSSAVTLEIIDDVYDATYNKIPCELIGGTVTAEKASIDEASVTSMETGEQTNAAGVTVTAQNESVNSTETTDPAAPVEKTSSQKTNTIILSVCGVLVIGAAIAFVVRKKKQPIQ